MVSIWNLKSDVRMHILVTGAYGFIGKNLVVHLQEQNHTVITFGRGDDVTQLLELVEQAEVVVHLAGENRPEDVAAFKAVNTGLTQNLCDALRATGRHIPLLFASSIQAERNNPYGQSKLAAEKVIAKLAEDTGSPAYIYRLPNVFGKWSKPNYNSVVATFCYNIVHGLPIQVNDESTQLALVYVDDVVTEFMRVLDAPYSNGVHFLPVLPKYQITLGGLVNQIKAFKKCRDTLMIEDVGKGLTRALYSTYISYFDTDRFSYSIPSYADERGVFVEVLKTKSSGQFSFFTAKPGITRGEHYHHTKTEKFLVIKGKARFGFRHMVTNEKYELFTSGDEPRVVDTVPGWTHDITNIGEAEMIVMLWANEVFDRERPDTKAAKV